MVSLLTLGEVKETSAVAADAQKSASSAANGVHGDRLLTRAEIVDLRAKRQLLFEPVLNEAKQIGDTGVDLRLDCFFREFVRTRKPFISPADDDVPSALVEIEPYRDSFFLQPGEFVLAQSLEYLALPTNVYGILNGRSSFGRRGLVVHATANVVDPGWKGHLVFELANLGTMPIELTPLIRVARLVLFFTTSGDGYSGAYKGQLRIQTPPCDRLMQAILQARET